MTGFYYPTFASHTVKWEWAKEPVYPMAPTKDYPHQLRGVTAGGTLYVQEKGVSRVLHTLNWERISKTDRDQAETFFDTVKKSLNTFQYRDIDGVNHTVRWNNDFNFRNVIRDLYSGSVKLREE